MNIIRPQVISTLQVEERRLRDKLFTLKAEVTRA